MALEEVQIHDWSLAHPGKLNKSTKSVRLVSSDIPAEMLDFALIGVKPGP